MIITYQRSETGRQFAILNQIRPILRIAELRAADARFLTTTATLCSSTPIQIPVSLA
jgi:hypothetical protein